MWAYAGVTWLRSQKKDEHAGQWRMATARLAVGTWLARAAVWVALVCGPAGLLVAVAGGQSPAAPDARRSGASMQLSAMLIGPAGYAQLYLAGYLRAGRGAMAELRSYFPDAPDVDRPAGSRVAAGAPVVLSAVQVDPGYFSVGLAVEVLSASGSTWVSSGVHCFSVPVVAVGQSGSDVGYVAAALPTKVACPVRTDPVPLGYGTAVGVSTPLGDTVTRWLSALLAGQGELSRYTSPEHPLRPVTPPPYVRVSIHSLLALGDHSVADVVTPVDRARVRVLVEARAVDAAGHTDALTYALTLGARDGRWEVVSLDPAPELSTGKSPEVGASARPAPSPR